MRVMQIRTSAIRIHVKWAGHTQRDRQTCWPGCEELEPHALLGGCEMGQPVQKKAWQVLERLHTEFPYGPATALLGIPKRNENVSPHKHTRVLMAVLS